MINRSYLPYKSAREYLDRGMAKWMGFFISDTIDFTKAMDEEEKLFFLSWAFFNNKKILLYTNLQKEPYLGKIYDMTKEKLYLNMKNRTPNFLYSQILKLTVAEVIEDE